MRQRFWSQTLVAGLLSVVMMSLGASRLKAQANDWYAFGGDSERDGWDKNELMFVKDDVKTFQLLWQRKLDNHKQGVGAVMPPIVLGRLIGYRGFKELAIVAGSNNNLWTIDADLNRMYWAKHLEVAKAGCEASLTAAPAIDGPMVFRHQTANPASGTAGANQPQRPRANAFARFVNPHPIYLLTSDGVLHKFNQNDGSEMGPPTTFLPAGSMAQALNIYDDTVFTSTRAGCGHEAAVWSMNVDAKDPGIKSTKLDSDVAGLGGVIVGKDGGLFAQTKSGSVLGFDADLKVAKTFQFPEAEGKKTETSVTPVIFTFQDQEMIAAANQDGRIYLLKASDMGGADHHQFVSKSVVIPALDGKPGHGIWGDLSSWEEADGSRYVLAPVWGPLNEDVQSALPGTDAPNGSIVAFRLDSEGGVPTLKPAWVSRDLDAPSPAVVGEGIVFALANGKFSHLEKKIQPVKGTHATLYALDGTTGKELYSTADQLKAAGNLAGMTLANSRVYFVTVDNTLQVFGKYIEH